MGTWKEIDATYFSGRKELGEAVIQRYGEPMAVNPALNTDGALQLLDKCESFRLIKTTDGYAAWISDIKTNMWHGMDKTAAVAICTAYMKWRDWLDERKDTQP